MRMRLSVMSLTYKHVTTQFTTDIIVSNFSVVFALYLHCMYIDCYIQSYTFPG